MATSAKAKEGLGGAEEEEVGGAAAGAAAGGGGEEAVAPPAKAALTFSISPSLSTKRAHGAPTGVASPALARIAATYPLSKDSTSMSALSDSTTCLGEVGGWVSLLLLISFSSSFSPRMSPEWVGGWVKTYHNSLPGLDLIPHLHRPLDNLALGHGGGEGRHGDFVGGDTKRRSSSSSSRRRSSRGGRRRRRRRSSRRSTRGHGRHGGNLLLCLGEEGNRGTHRRRGPVPKDDFGQEAFLEGLHVHVRLVGFHHLFGESGWVGGWVDWVGGWACFDGRTRPTY